MCYALHSFAFCYALLRLIARLLNDCVTFCVSSVPGLQDFSKPGHLFPLCARPGGVLECPGAGLRGILIERLTRTHKDSQGLTRVLMLLLLATFDNFWHFFAIQPAICSDCVKSDRTHRIDFRLLPPGWRNTCWCSGRVSRSLKHCSCHISHIDRD